MMWEQVAADIIAQLEAFITRIAPQIQSQAEETPQTPFVPDAQEVADLVALAETADEDLNEAVVDQFMTMVTVPVEDDIRENSNPFIAFFIAKMIIDGIQRIHSASIARQVLDVDRGAVIDRALQRTLALITGAIEAESSSSFALKHQELAINNDFRYYRYHTSEDDVVRGLHASRNQRVFAYGQERVADDVPGLANRCRCFAEPLTLDEALEGSFFYPEDRPNTQARTDNNMPRKFYKKINALSASDEVVIDIVGAIDEWDGNDFDTFESKVRSYLPDETTPLVLNVTSHGGDGLAGKRAYDLIKSLPNQVTSHIYGFAGSAATHFVVASDIATIGENDTFFIHQAWSCIPCGNKQQIERDSAALIDTLTDFDEVQVAMYVAKSGKSEAEVTALLNEERVINADEAMEFGFIDQIRPESNRSMAARGESAFAAKFNALNAHHKPEEDSIMTFEQLMALFGANQDLQAQVTAALVPNLAELQASVQNAATLQATVTSLETQVAEQKSVIQAAGTKPAEISAEQREEIRTELKAEIVAETEARTKLTNEVKDAGYEVEGDTNAAILANAIQAAGGTIEGLPEASYAAVWASIYSMRKGGKGEGTNNAEDFTEDGATPNADGSNTPAVTGSRANRINS